MKVSALIVRAGLMPQNLTALGYMDWVGAVTDLGDGPTMIWSLVRLSQNRWLTPGLRVTLDVDASRVGKLRCFTVVWSSVPRIKKRVADNDPTLADPRAAWAAAAQARADATETHPMLRTLMGPGRFIAQPQTGPGVHFEPWNARCDDAIAKTGTAPAPPGSQRVVAIVVAMRMVLRDVGRDLFTGRPKPEGRMVGQGKYRRALTGNQTVFSVNVVGRPPWSVFAGGFRAPGDKPATRYPSLYPFLPATVPADQPGPVSILWDEVTPARQIVHGMAAAAPPPSVQQPSVQQPPPVTGLPPEAQVNAYRFAQSLRALPPAQHPAAIQQALASLNAVPPEQRPLYIALWRSYGVPI